MFSQEKPPKRYFIPEPDITAYEVALCINLMSITATEARTAFLLKHSELHRHFKTASDIDADPQ